MQPAAGDRSAGGIKKQKGMTGIGAPGGGTVNSEAFWRKKVEDVPVDQVRTPSMICRVMADQAAVLP
jgi:ribosome biogenesis protein MAK21